MKIGRHSYLGTYDERFNPEVEIGNFTSIGSGLIVYGTCEHPQTISTFPFADKGWSEEYPKTFSRGKIIIGSDVWISEDVKILDGITIGDGAIIGSGAVVSKNIPAYAIAVGNPIEVKSYRFTQAQIQELLRLKWWDLSDDEIKEMLPLMADKDKFFEGL